MINLREQINYVVSQVLFEMKSGFNWSEFKAIDNHLKRFKYLERHAKFLGTGSSRAAFQLGPKHVLKIANTRAYDEVSPKGTAQNEMEVDVYTNPKTKPVVAKVFDYGPDYIWIVAEYVKPLNGNFQKELGFNQLALERAVELLQRHDGDKDKTEKYIDKSLARWKSKLQSGEVPPDELQYKIDSIKDFEEAHKALQHPIVFYIWHLIKDVGVDFSDLVRSEHWGTTSDGRLVVLDYGFTTEIADKFYTF